MIKLAVPAQTEEDEATPKEEEKIIPEFGSLDWIYYWSESEGELPTPIDVSITGSQVYKCPDLVWYNFEVFPHKIKLTNTGYTVLLGAKWKTERPYLEGGPFLEKHILSQVHFHWGSNMMEGSEHTVDKRCYPGEMQVTFFRSEYMTQEEALKHNDGVVMICYIIKIFYEVNKICKRTCKAFRWVLFITLYCTAVCINATFGLLPYNVNPDPRLQWVIEGFPRIREAQTHTRIGPYPMSQLLPLFFEDYFLYWGSLKTVKGESHVVRWIIPRTTLFASFEQINAFRKLWDPWDVPNLRNFRPLQDRNDRHILFISPHWCQYNSLLPIPAIPDPPITILSPAYQANPWMLPKQNTDLLSQPEDNDVNK